MITSFNVGMTGFEPAADLPDEHRDTLPVINFVRN